MDGWMANGQLKITPQKSSSSSLTIAFLKFFVLAPQLLGDAETWAAAAAATSARTSEDATTATTKIWEQKNNVEKREGINKKNFVFKKYEI